MIFGYGKVLSAYDEALTKYFGNFKIYNKESLETKVPITYCNDDRFNLLSSGSSQKIELPLVNLFRTNFFKRNTSWLLEYQLTLRTLLQKDMDQLLEQLMISFAPYAEVTTDSVGDLELDIKKFVVDDNFGQKEQWTMAVTIPANMHINVCRSDWTISTEVKR